MSDFRNLLFYRKAFDNAMRIFEITKTFPTDERYGLISQMRRSARSVCANIAEAYRKRRFEKHFIAKISDADMENSETIVWLEFALACQYISRETQLEISRKYEEVGRMLNFAMENPNKFR